MKHYLSSLLLLIALLPLAGCDTWQEELPPCPEPGRKPGDLHFSFRIIASNTPGTRADDQGHPEQDSEYIPVENEINAGDFAFFIFAGEGSDAKLLTKVLNITGNEDKIAGGQGIYTVNLDIPQEQALAAFGRVFTPGSGTQVKMRAVTLANSYSYEPSNNVSTLPQAEGETTYAQFMQAAEKMAVNLLADLYSPTPGNSEVEGLYNDASIDGIYKGKIPMFGNKVFTTTEGELCESRHDAAVWLGETWMLRSVAKVRVEDNIENRDAATGYPRVVAADVLCQTNTVYQLPHDAANYRDGQQVHTARIYPATGATTFQLGYLPNEKDEGVKRVRIGYLPEQNINPSVQVIRVRVAYDADSSHDRTFDVPMTGTFNGIDINSFGTQILRNHVYTLSVNKAETGAPAEITVTVNDWNDSSLNLDYSETVNVANHLAWTAGSYQSLDGAGNLILRPWTNTPVPAVCTFGISDPVGAAWTASLVSISGTQGAFAFLDSDGNQVPSVSGTIDGKSLVTLSIISVDNTPSVSSSARLQIIVRLANGKYIEAPVVDQQQYPGVNNFTIIQNQQ